MVSGERLALQTSARGRGWGWSKTPLQASPCQLGHDPAGWESLTWGWPLTAQLLPGTAGIAQGKAAGGAGVTQPQALPSAADDILWL